MPQDLPLQPDWLDVHQPSQGRYVLGPLLGEGGSGEVREAWDMVLCRSVALKLLRSMEPDQLIRFLHEAQVQSRMVHPNICRDNGPELATARAILERRPTLAPPAQDRLLRMVLHWREAQRSLGQGRAPDRELALALRDLGHTSVLLARDHLGDVLNFAARLELRRGQDPRPTLAWTLARSNPEDRAACRTRPGSSSRRPGPCVRRVGLPRTWRPPWPRPRRSIA
jgi:hypothetical protein